MSPPVSAQLVMIRLLDYIELSGVPVGDEMLFQLTALLQAGIADGRDDLFDWCLQRLDGGIRVEERSLPAPAPPIRRGSIGYGHRP